MVIRFLFYETLINIISKLSGNIGLPSLNKKNINDCNL